MGRSKRRPIRDRKHASGRRRNRPRQCNVNVPKKVKESLSASAKKIREEDIPSSNFEGYRLFDLSLLFESLQETVCCTVCHGAVVFAEISLRGLGGKYEIRCNNCASKKTFHSSSTVEDGRGYEINRRSALAMRCIGQGLAGLNTFCGIMDLPPPVQLSTWKKIGQKLLNATKEVVQENMKKAVEEEIDLTTNDDVDVDEPIASTSTAEPDNRCITVQGDATWQRRGFSSLNAVFTVIGTETGKVLDQEVLSLWCRQCRKWASENKNATEEEKDNWRKAHGDMCTKNSSGSSGSMEVDGIMKIFHRSVEKYDVKYTNYIGDGDTKSHAKVSSSMPYGPNIEIKKIECTGHVQKRFGNRARKLKASLAGKKLSDGKTIGGRGRLTNALIDEMQSYYGNAIRNNSASVKDMTEAIWAIWYHKASTDEKPQHHFCPPGETSWCQYRRAEATGREEDYRHPKKKVMPAAVMMAIKQIFEDLTSPNLLQRCIGAKTQNANESLHSVIWKFCPKTVFTGINTVQIASNLGTIQFNSGPAGIIKVMKSLGTVPGKHAVTAARKKADVRVTQAEQKAEANSKDARIKRRRLHMQEEDDSYVPGGF